MKDKQDHLYIDEVSHHRRRYLKLVQFTQSSTKAAAVMLLAAVVALIVANSALYPDFLSFWHADITVGFGSSVHTMSLAHVINDILMALFFLSVGLEIKYEMAVGELHDVRAALLPIFAACGGVLVPIVIYLAFNAGSGEAANGWGVPTATDIAFALGILALLGSRVPSGIKVFLSTLAVADDIIAILVIAIFYGESPDIGWLCAAAAVVAILVLCNKNHVYALVPYLLLGALLWYCVFMSGIHSTIAGVLLAFTIPTGSSVNPHGFTHWGGAQVSHAHEAYEPGQPVLGQQDYLATVAHLSRVARQVVPPAVRLDHALSPWVSFLILPVFALTNADVSLGATSFETVIESPVFLGVLLGLLLGKPIGIMAFSAFIIKIHAAELPKGANWMHMFGASVLGGVGFTMAIFVANLAFADASLIMTAKVGILCASTIAGVIGFLILFFQARRTSSKEGTDGTGSAAVEGDTNDAIAEPERGADGTSAAVGHGDDAGVEKQLQ